MHKLGVIIATKDRPDDLRRTLESLATQSKRPEQVVVVDVSQPAVDSVVQSFAGRLAVVYRKHWPPSAAAQRNAGLGELADEITLVSFMDDDIVLEHNAIANMLEYWQQHGERLGGASFNLMNVGKRAFAGIKSSGLLEALGLYPKQQGHVAPSGWQSIVDPPERDIDVQWLSSCASVWRREVFQTHQFDPYFDGYSYLEDLDFSYSVGKQYRLSIVADARFCHYPAAGGRVSQYQFGRVEVRNRLYFVRKHRLSVGRCYLSLLMRMGMTLGQAVVKLDGRSWGRFRGNLRGLVQADGDGK